MEEKKDIEIERKELPKSIAVNIQQMIFTDLGNYGGIHTGIDKFFYLKNVIYQLTSHLIVNYGKEWFEKRMAEELKNTPLKYKTWDEVNKVFEKMKPHLDRVKIYYDDIRGRKEIPKEKQVKINSLVRKVSPYQIEIFFVFNILMKISGMQRHTIPKQYFKTLEDKKYIKSPFERMKPFAESRDLVMEEK
jgi:hypothetical protein